MPQRKPRRRKPSSKRPPASPALPSAGDQIAPPNDDSAAAVPTWNDRAQAVILALPIAATVFIWMTQAGFQNGQQLILTAIVWAIALVGAISRLLARRTATRLEAQLAHAEVVAARLRPGITIDQSAIGTRQVSAWIIAALGVVAAIVLWQINTLDQTLQGRLTNFIATSALGVLLALAIAANTINSLKTRRVTRDFVIALQSERLALDTLRGIDSMICACLPTGERTRFNENYLKFVGRSNAQLHGRGWLDIIHPDDHKAALEIVARPLTSERPREHQICVRHHDGEYVWLHETLTPRYNEKGEFIEFIATCSDISRQVEKEVALGRKVNDLQADLTRVQGELEETRTELADTRLGLANAKAQLLENEGTVADALDKARHAQQALMDAKAGVERQLAEAADHIRQANADAQERMKLVVDEAKKHIAKVEHSAELAVRKAVTEANAKVERLQADSSRNTELLEGEVKSARQEHELLLAEKEKLQRAFETLQDEVAALRLQDAAMKEQLASHLKESRTAGDAASKARLDGLLHSAENEKLRQRQSELESQLASAAQALAQAQAAAKQAQLDAASRLEQHVRESSPEALANHLRPQVDAIRRLTSELLAQALDGPARSAAHNAAATARAMGELVDRATNAADSAAKDQSHNSTFDLRHTIEGVRELLSPAAETRATKVEIEIDPKLRAVHADEIELRTALYSLSAAALALVNEGTLTLALCDDVTTDAHSTIRAELRHKSARPKNETLESALALASTDDKLPDPAREPAAHQAALAWRTIRRLQGQHGYLLPSEGGFTVWFTFTLPRPGAASHANAHGAAGDVLPSPTPRDSQGSSQGAAREAMPAPAPRVSDTPSQGAVAEGHPTPAPRAEATASSRPLPRMPVEGLTCNLGDVVEMGADSLRLTCAKPPKDAEVTVTLDTDMPEDLRAQVSWSKKINDKKHDVGLRLLGLSEGQRRHLIHVALQHRKAVPMLGLA